MSVEIFGWVIIMIALFVFAWPRFTKERVEQTHKVARRGDAFQAAFKKAENIRTEPYFDEEGFQRVLILHQQSRPLPPMDAQDLLVSDCQKPNTRKNEHFCPKCFVDLKIRHGDRLLCGCGWIIESYGNLMTIWEDKYREPNKKTRPFTTRDLRMLARAQHF